MYFSSWLGVIRFADLLHKSETPWICYRSFRKLNKPWRSKNTAIFQERGLQDSAQSQYINQRIKSSEGIPKQQVLFQYINFSRGFFIKYVHIFTGSKFMIGAFCMLHKDTEKTKLLSYGINSFIPIFHVTFNCYIMQGKFDRPQERTGIKCCVF